MRRLSIKKPLALALATLFVPVPAGAERSVERNAHVATSTRHGFSGRAVQLLRRLPGPGREVVVTRMLTKLASGIGSRALHADGAASVRAADGVSVVAGRGWKLRVAGNGERVGYMNFEFLEQRALEFRAPVANAPRIASLEPHARDFIRNELGEVIRLGQNERLIAWKTLHRIDAEGDASGAELAEGVAATIIDFKREIDGLPVLGPGSTVSITFASDGSIAGFDYDWAELEQVGKTVRTAPASKMQKRVELLTRQREAMSLRTTGAALAAAQTAQGVDTPRLKRTSRDFVCGYHDPGAESSVDSIVQPACVNQYVEEDTNTGLTSGVVHIVPLAETVSPVVGWMETNMLRPTD